MLCNMASTSFGSGCGSDGAAGGGDGAAGGGDDGDGAPSSISGASGTGVSGATSARRGGPAPLRFDFARWIPCLDFRLSCLLWSLGESVDILRPS